MRKLALLVLPIVTFLWSQASKLPEWETTAKLRYAPRTVVAPTIVQAPVGAADIGLAADEDAILELPRNEVRAGPLRVRGGRNVRIIGGDMGRQSFTTGRYGRSTTLSDYEWGPTQSMFIEGLKFDLALGFPTVNGNLAPPDDAPPEADAIHVIGAAPYTEHPPDIYVQNCNIANPRGTTNRHGKAVPVKSVSYSKTNDLYTVVTAASHGLQASIENRRGARLRAPFICGPTTEPRLSRTYEVVEITSPTEVKAKPFRPERVPGRNDIPDGLTGTGGYLWAIDPNRSGLHADCFQASACSIFSRCYFYKVTMMASCNGYIGGHTAADTETRAVSMTRVNIRPNDVWPHDDVYSAAYFGNWIVQPLPAKSEMGPYPNIWGATRVGEFHADFDRVYAKPRLGQSFVPSGNFTLFESGSRRWDTNIAAYTNDGGRTVQWPSDTGKAGMYITGHLTYSPDAFGEGGKDYADLNGPKAPGLNYISPGYSSDAVQPLKLRAITIAGSRLDVEFTGDGHIIDLALTGDAGGRFKLHGRDVTGEGPGTITVKASEHGNPANAILKTMSIR